MIPIPWRLLGVAALAVGSVLAYKWWAGHQQQIGEDRATARYEAALTAQKQEAGRKLAHATARALRAEIDMQRGALEQAEKDRQNEATANDLRGRLAAGGGRLRDPAGCGRSGGNAPATSAASSANSDRDAAEAPGLLSASLSGLLRALTAEADRINNAYISSRADAARMREQCFQPTTE